MEQGFVRMDGKRKSSTCWFVYHHLYINMWEQCHGSIIQPSIETIDRDKAIWRYMHLYRGWASLYLLRAPCEAPTTFGARSVSDKILRKFFERVESYLHLAFGTREVYMMQLEDVKELESLCYDVRRNIYINEANIDEDSSTIDEEPSQHDDVHRLMIVEGHRHFRVLWTLKALWHIIPIH